MPGYSTLSRFSQAQLQSEKRKQQAHLKKINDMQRQSKLDNSSPHACPHIHQGFVRQLGEKRQVIDKENELKSKKLLGIMTSRAVHFPPPSYSPNPAQRNRTTHPAQNNTDFLDRVAKTRGRYDTEKWKKDYQEHRGYLKLRKNNSVFTPLDVGSNREGNSKANSVVNTARTSPHGTSSDPDSNGQSNDKTISSVNSKQTKLA
ncbi:unnamed protein product [Adineta ricciae]|uniref:Uncharacterized protein n=1 Tax=Adineta ricciae TaxID=249248 RepID=A0A815S3G1_ADIRI|nr:unnamed protein product [Adineta ricciae]